MISLQRSLPSATPTPYPIGKARTIVNRTPIFGIAAPHKGARKDGLIIVIIPLRGSGADETTDGQSEFGGAVDRITRSAAYRIAVIGEKQRGVFD